MANIAQLAVDLLIASLSLRKVGVFDSRDLVPVIGGREDGEAGITTALECVWRLPLMPCALTNASDLGHLRSIRTGRERNRAHSAAVFRIGGTCSMFVQCIWAAGPRS
jgi:hypothetical protein